MHVKNKGLMLVFLTALVSGFSIFINSYGVKGFDSSIFTFSKNLVVGVLLLGIILGLGQLRHLGQLSRKQWLQLAGIGLLGGSIPFLLFFRGLQIASGATSAFIHKTLFIWVSILAVWLLKEKVTKGLLIGAALLLAGNFLFLRPHITLSMGHALILLATLLWAAENTWSKHAVKNISGTVVAWGRMTFGAGFIFAFLLATGKAPFLLSMSATQCAWIVVTSAFLLLYVLSFYNGIGYINISTATSILVLGSPITTTLNWIFNGASVTVYEGIGMLLILGGVVSVVWFTELSQKIKALLTSPAYERD